MRTILLSLIVLIVAAIKGDNFIEELLWAELETATITEVDVETVDRMFAPGGTLHQAYSDSVCISALNSFTKNLF